MKKTNKKISQRGKENTKNQSLLVSLTKNGHFKSYFKNCEPALKSLLKAFPHEGFSERILFYWAKNYISQLKKGEEYEKLCPSYSLIFSQFDLFPCYGTGDLSKKPISDSARSFSGVRSGQACNSLKPISDSARSFSGVRSGQACNSFSIRSDKAPHFCFNRDLRFVTVELSKFQSNGDMSTLVDFQDIWCYILKESKEMGHKEFKELLGRGPEMEEAMTYLRKFSEAEQRQILSEAREKNRRDRVAREAYVFNQGKEEGIEKGRAEGRAEGIKKGKEEGMQKGRKEMVLKMLKNGASINFVSKVTGLSKEEINKLKNGS